MTQTEHRNSAPNAQQAPQPAESGAPENLNRAGRYDLHIHSAISDGTQSLTELVPLIARAGLAGFALTDHDTTAGWAQAAQLAGEYGLDFLPGAEFSCRYRYTDGEGRARTKTIHLLAYGFDPVGSELARSVEAIRASRAGRAQAIVGRLAADYPLTWDDVLAQVGEGNTAVGRPILLMRWLLPVWLLTVLRLLRSCCTRAAPTMCPRMRWTRWRRCVWCVRLGVCR